MKLGSAAMAACLAGAMAMSAAPPMPQYRFNRKDAEAIVAYLKSLGK